MSSMSKELKPDPRRSTLQIRQSVHHSRKQTPEGGADISILLPCGVQALALRSFGTLIFRDNPGQSHRACYVPFRLVSVSVISRDKFSNNTEGVPVPPRARLMVPVGVKLLQGVRRGL